MIIHISTANHHPPSLLLHPRRQRIYLNFCNNLSSTRLFRLCFLLCTFHCQFIRSIHAVSYSLSLFLPIFLSFFGFRKLMFEKHKRGSDPQTQTFVVRGKTQFSSIQRSVHMSFFSVLPVVEGYCHFVVSQPTTRTVLK